MEYRDETSALVELDGMKVHSRRTGRGPTLLLLHGSGSSLHIFDAAVAILARDFDVVRVDLPGFGVTGPRPDRDYSVGAYVSFLDRFADAVGLERFVAAGHSFGGQVAWTYALSHPGRLTGLVLMNATGYPDKSVPLVLRLARNPLTRPLVRHLGSPAATRRSLVRLAGPGSSVVDDAMVDRVHAFTSGPDAKQAFIDFASTEQPDRTAELADIATPTLVLRSDLVDGQHFGRDIPDCREVLLPDVGHLMPVEAPHVISGAIARFVQALDEQEQ
ncbi:alpha/beta hydrolase [Nocardioides aromaticivorans]|uniref:Alpha/beta hydrolase n=1 Tax=Nocardioides aromaticivorans TaxID=200618 RepID=A0ABX7PS31_9ACTN|nr:alpha/beta hydrolase [Nocardioides aromaticivorans]